jgi:hypothetical protein
MIRKHVDLIAIGLLLGGIAIYSHARTFVSLEMNSSKRMVFVHRHSDSRVIAPAVPRIPFTRD